MNFHRFLLPALLLGATAPSMAGVPAAQYGKVVSSLSVTGTIEVDPLGNVAGYAIQDAEAYDHAVLDLLDRNISRWHFKPVLIDGVARQARFDMYLRLQAKPLDEKRFEVEIASAAFGSKEAGKPHTTIAAREKIVPRYPEQENFLGVGGTVVTVVRVGRSGKVEQIIVEQTNLKAVGRNGAMEQWRKDLERAALAAAKRWTFTPPTVGEEASRQDWSVRIPFAFIPYGASANTPPGQWESYVPGPRQRVAWARKDAGTADTGVDALPGGRMFPLEQPLHLLTALNPK